MTPDERPLEAASAGSLAHYEPGHATAIQPEPLHLVAFKHLEGELPDRMPDCWEEYWAEGLTRRPKTGWIEGPGIEVTDVTLEVPSDQDSAPATAHSWSAVGMK